MIQAEYKHPNFPPSQATKHIVKDEPDHQIIRLEYPDGVIVVFELTAEQVTVHSNYNYSFDADRNIISPRLDSPNNDFNDFT